MRDEEDNIQALLADIRDLLVPISGCFRLRYEQIQREQAEFEEFAESLTPVRRKVYPLLFDPRNLTQTEIAREVDANPSTVHRFVRALLERRWIEEDVSGEARYREKLPFRHMMEVENDEGQERSD